MVLEAEPESQPGVEVEPEKEEIEQDHGVDEETEEEESGEEPRTNILQNIEWNRMCVDLCRNSYKKVEIKTFRPKKLKKRKLQE